MIEFKKLETEPQQRGWRRIVQSAHLRKSLIAIAIGALAGFGLFYFTEGRSLDAIVFQDYAQNLFFGAFLGFFVTNSPCARNRC